MKKFSLIKKHWWYLVLLFSSSIFVYANRYIILQEKLNDISVMVLIFFCWLVLLFLPLFSEIEIVGVKLKRELEKTREELSHEIKEVRLDIVNLKFSNKNSSTVTVENNYLANGERLKEMKNEWSNSAQREDHTGEKKVENIRQYNLSNKLDLPEVNIFLFKVRTYLEKNLVDICSKLGFERLQNTREMIRFLNQKELINGKTVDLLTEINKISSRGIHGEILSEEYINFINEALPEVEQIFQSIYNRID